MPDDQTDSFYRLHRGGCGNVVVATILDEEGDFVASAVFSSIEVARSWVDKFDDEARAVICPYIVDEPSFGELTAYQRN